jgi:hypothetical protein
MKISPAAPHLVMRRPPIAAEAAEILQFGANTQQRREAIEGISGIPWCIGCHAILVI